MPEPIRFRLRRTTMKPSVILPCLLAALVLAGCGNESSASQGSSSGTASSNAPEPASNAPSSSASAGAAPATASTIGACAPDAPGVTKATALTTVDLDGDGTPEQVRLTAPDGSCPGVVFAKVGSGYLSAQVPTDGPPVRSAFGVPCRVTTAPCWSPSSSTLGAASSSGRTPPAPTASRS